MISEIIDKIDGFVWGPVMILFLLGSHIYLTIRTRFVQKHVFKGIVLSLTNEKGKKGDLSIFGSLMTALSSTVGTGNIIGVGTAIALGGAGAVFWTWIGGLFGIATKYAESFIAVKYRKKQRDGSYIGGAMTALEKLKKPKLAKLFAILGAVAAFGIGCATQANSITDSINANLNIPKNVVAIVLCVLTAIVIFGGVKSIASVCEKLVPIMAIVYTVGCTAILFINRAYLPETISVILKSAFSAKAIGAGFIGHSVIKTMQYGVARGLFSNEAGMGSAPMATAVGDANNAVKPALVGSTGVFWDTLVVCLMTGLVICSSVLANDSISLVNINDGARVVTMCFGQIPFGTPLLVFGILTFAYSTILGWSFYGETCAEYLFGKKSITIYRVLWIVVIFVGGVGQLNTVWTIADILNALMCIPNIIAVLLFTDIIAKETKYYLDEGHLDEEDPDLE